MSKTFKAIELGSFDLILSIRGKFTRTTMMTFFYQKSPFQKNKQTKTKTKTKNKTRVFAIFLSKKAT